MDKELEYQYEATLGRLVASDIDGKHSERLLKIIRSVAKAQDRPLRSDALLFLLINGQFMLSEPYAVYRRMASAEQYAEFEHSAAVIIERLEGDKPYSAHAVMRAVEAAWETLTVTYGWA